MRRELSAFAILMSFAAFAQQTANGPTKEPLSNSTGTNIQRGSCTEDIDLEITLDNFGSEITWVLYDQTFVNVVASGGPYADGMAGTVITENLCLDADCYRLEFFDDGNNGIANGGYVLKDLAGRRIIDADGNYGGVSALGGPGTFCVPLSNVSLISSWCDRTDLLYHPSTQIYSTFVGGAKGYQFWIFDPHGSYNRRVYITQQNLHPTFLQTLPVPADIDLNVRVRAFLSPLNTATPFGKVCVIRLNTPQNLLRSELAEENPGKEVRVIPNPTTGANTRIELFGEGWSKETLTIEVVDATGRVMHRELSATGVAAPIGSMGIRSDLPAGLYFARVTQGSEQIITRFLVQD